MQRCISNQTYVGLLGNKDNMSKGLLERYPNAPIMFKDTLFVDFLNLPKKHSESILRNGLVEHMKQFILELGRILYSWIRNIVLILEHLHSRLTYCSFIVVYRHWLLWN